MKIEEVEEIYTQMESDDRPKDALNVEIKKAMELVFEPDSKVSSLPYIQGRKFALPDIADAKNAGTRVFTSLMPNINVMPSADNEGEYERVDKIEAAWDYELARMNRPINGSKGIFDLIVDSAMTYHAVAVQTEYLPYKFKGREKDNRVKAMLARKCFNWTVYDILSVRYQSSEYGLERSVIHGEYTAQQLVDRFGRDNDGVKQMLGDMKSTKPQDLLRTKFKFRDYLDWENRISYAKGGKTGYEFQNEKHDLPFFPITIVDYGEPIWKAIIQSGVWNNVQHMGLIRFAKAVAQAGKPDFWVRSPDGSLKGVWLAWDNPLNPMVLPAGTETGDFRENRLDPQFEAEYQGQRGDVARSTISRILQDPSQYINAPFSTLSASVNMALGQLTPAKKVAESAISEAIHQSMEWVKYSKIPFVVYRPYNSDSKVEGGDAYKMGEQIIITHEEPPTEEEIAKMNEKELVLQSKMVYFDLPALQVNVELQSANMTDEQSRLNVLINAKDKLGMSKKEAWERMGWKNFEQNQIQVANETMDDVELQKQAQLEMLESPKAEQQNQMQNQNMIREQNSANQFASLQGVDMRGGMNPASQVAPLETREQINGQAMNGQPI